jgi:glutamate-1-semialdehyde 2,1-aminomutase
MSAGIATLTLLEDGTAYTQLEALAARLENGLREAAAAANVPVVVQRVGSMLTPFFVAAGQTTVRNYAEALQCDTALFGRFFRGMLERGIMLPPSQFEAWFVSTAHTEGDVDQTIEVAKGALAAAITS